MHEAAGVHAGPKWKHVPAPLDWHERYALTPAWYTHVGTRQAMSSGAGSGGPGRAPALPLPPPPPPGPTFAVPPPAEPLPGPVGCFGSGCVPHPRVTTRATAIVSA